MMESEKRREQKGRIGGWIVLVLLLLIAVAIVALRWNAGRDAGQMPEITESPRETEPVTAQPENTEIPDAGVQTAASEISPADMQTEAQATAVPAAPAYEPPVFRPERGYEPGPMG